MAAAAILKTFPRRATHWIPPSSTEFTTEFGWCTVCRTRSMSAECSSARKRGEIPSLGDIGSMLVNRIFMSKHLVQTISLRNAFSNELWKKWINGHERIVVRRAPLQINLYPFLLHVLLRFLSLPLLVFRHEVLTSVGVFDEVLSYATHLLWKIVFPPVSHIYANNDLLVKISICRRKLSFGKLLQKL